MPGMRKGLAKGCLLATAAACVAGVLALSGCAFLKTAYSRDGKNEAAYAEAMALYRQGQYQAAADAFSTLSDYLDADERAEQCQALVLGQRLKLVYDQAAALQRQEQYALAMEKFASIPDYLDAQIRAEQCRQALLDKDYAEAVTLFQALPSAPNITEGLEQAGDAFVRLEDFRDSQMVGRALFHLAEGKYTLAAREALEGLKSGDEGVSRDQWLELFAALARAQSPMEGVRVLAGRRLLLQENYTHVLDSIPAGDEGELAFYLDGYDLPDWGAASRGKVLCIVRRDNYYRDDTAYIDGAFMQLVPEDMQPDSLDQLRYLVTVDYGYKKIQRFTTYYTQGIREYALIRIFDGESGRYVFKQTVNGPSSARASDAVMASDVISCGPPEQAKVAEAMCDALMYLVGGSQGRIHYLSIDGGAYLLSGGTDTVPPAVNGLPVLGIQAGFLAGEKAQRLTELVLPDTLWYIPAGAFCGLKALTAVTVPPTVIHIGEGAFGEQVVIRGRAGSAAEAYAAQNGLGFEAISG